MRTACLSVALLFHEILSALACDVAVVDGMHGTVVIASQTTRTPSVVQPFGRCTLDVCHRAHPLALAALRADILIDPELVGITPTEAKNK